MERRPRRNVKWEMRPDNEATSDIENQRATPDKKLKKQKKITDFFPQRRSQRKTNQVILAERKQKLIKSILNGVEDGVEQKIFPGKGRGVVTTKKFFKNEFVVEYSGELIDWSTAKKRETKYAQDPRTGCYMYFFRYMNQQYCVDATKETNRLGRLINHSRNGNLYTQVVEIEVPNPFSMNTTTTTTTSSNSTNKEPSSTITSTTTTTTNNITTTTTTEGGPIKIPKLILLAKRDISESEELSYDYGDRRRVALKHHPWLAN